MKHKKQKKTKKAGRILLAVFAVVIGTLGVLLFTSERWMRKTWPNLSMEELVYQLKAPIAGTSHDLLMSYVCSSALIAAAALILLILVSIFLGKTDVVCGKLGQLRDIVFIECSAGGFVCIGALHGFQIEIDQISFLFRERDIHAVRIYVVVFYHGIVRALIFQIIFYVQCCPHVIDGIDDAGGSCRDTDHPERHMGFAFFPKKNADQNQK